MFKKIPNSGWKNFNHKKPKKVSKFLNTPSKEKVNKKSFLGSKMVVPVYENKTVKKIITSFLSFGLRLTFIGKKNRSNKEQNNQLVENTYKKIQSKEFNFIPAGLALYLFMAFIPIWTIVFSIFSFNSEYTTILRVDILGRLIPGIESSIPAIQEFFSSGAGGSTALIILLISSLWLSSNGFLKFIRSQSLIYEHQNIENGFLLRIRSFFIVVGLSIFISLILLIVIPIIQLLKNYLKNNTAQFLISFYITTFIVIIFGSFIGFLLVFKISPSFKLKFKDVVPGAIISTIPTSLFVVIFGSISSIDIINYGNFGTIGTFMFLVILILQMAFYIYAGLIINASYYQTFIGKKLISKWKNRKRRIF